MSVELNKLLGTTEEIKPVGDLMGDLQVEETKGNLDVKDTAIPKTAEVFEVKLVTLDTGTTFYSIKSFYNNEFMVDVSFSQNRYDVESGGFVTDEESIAKSNELAMSLFGCNYNAIKTINFDEKQVIIPVYTNQVRDKFSLYEITSGEYKVYDKLNSGYRGLNLEGKIVGIIDNANTTDVEIEFKDKDHKLQLKKTYRKTNFNLARKKHYPDPKLFAAAHMRVVELFDTDDIDLIRQRHTIILDENGEQTNKDTFLGNTIVFKSEVNTQAPGFYVDPLSVEGVDGLFYDLCEQNGAKSNVSKVALVEDFLNGDNVPM